MVLENNIKQLRIENNQMSQQELAELVEVSRMTIYSIEVGKYTPSAALALRIAQVFSKPFEEVFYFNKGSEKK